jgi:hypothetical protein
VFWRDYATSWKGHVGIVVATDKEWVYVLGGNQGDSVCIAPYPKTRVLGFRKPK